ncbi:MAG: cytochrome c oxidase accessory protein CcoG [Pseudomonadota bacterium]
MADGSDAHPEKLQLYKKREPIYPKLAHGKYRALKWAVLIVTLGIYYGLPWVRWPRAAGEPNQAVLVDFEGGRFYFFFIEIWPSELYYVTGLLILGALGLFLITALLGRVWCGYACPQTVWTDLYIAVERLVEGDRNARIKLDRAAWTTEKVAKKGVKHALWLAIAAATGGAWVFYFHDAPSTLPKLFTGQAEGSAYLFLGVLTFTTYTLAGSMREQVCTYMCPWPRIQGALTDENALNVTYKHDRGEPRGPHKKGDSWDGRGDCIDCHACVVVCPMGIDIRDGAQLECIHCALCIDACDDIMSKVGRPKSLIGYDTELNLDQRLAGETQTYKLFRPRTVLYGLLMTFVAAVMAIGLIGRDPFTFYAERDRAPAFVTLSDGSVRNAYDLKIQNKRNAPSSYRITMSGVENAVLSAVGEEVAEGAIVISAGGDQLKRVRLFATVPANAAPPGATPATFSVEELETGFTVRKSTTFLAGG